MANKFVIHFHNEAGRYHKHHGIDTQDRCLIYTDPPGTYMVAAVADGASLSGNPIEAAEANVDVAKVLADNGDYYFSLSEKKFRQSVSTLCYEHLVDTGKPMQELCATVGFVLINLKTLDYVAYNIGDTGVYAVTTDMTVLEMLHPLNGLKKNETFFTNNVSLTRKYGAYKKGNMTDKLVGFIVCTDGAECISKTDFSQLCAGMLISDKAAGLTDARIIEKAGRMTSDDITYAVAMLQNDQTVASAEAIYNFSPAEAAISDTPAPEAEEPEHSEDTVHRLPAPETVLVLPASVPAAALSSLPTPAVILPPLLAFLEKPRTAIELIEANLGFDRDKSVFIAEIAVLIRLDLITCTEYSDGKIQFQAKTGA